MASTLPSVQDCCDSCTGEGVTLVMSTTSIVVVADLDALRALPTSVSNSTALVTGEDEAGLYWWDAANITADDGVTVIAPGDGGVGRWRKTI